MASELHTPVLIAGGGVVGLSSALFGAWHHLPCRLVERHPDLVRGRPHAGRRAAAHGIGADGALLVRPDGLVVWRTTLAAADPVRILRTSLHAALPTPGRGGAVAAVARYRRLCATRQEVFLAVQARPVVGAAC